MRARLPSRKSIPFPDYDYSTPGAYFVTICVQRRLCLFGTIADESIELNPVGQAAERGWRELPEKFPTVEAKDVVVMPNHLHGIIGIRDDDVGVAPCGRPLETGAQKDGRPHRGAPTLARIINWFKTMTTNEYIRQVNASGWPPFSARLWQRGYFEHVIRNATELRTIREYIAKNPERWASDPQNSASRISANTAQPEWLR